MVSSVIELDLPSRVTLNIVSSVTHRDLPSRVTTLGHQVLLLENIQFYFCLRLYQEISPIISPFGISLAKINSIREAYFGATNKICKWTFEEPSTN